MFFSSAFLLVSLMNLWKFPSAEPCLDKPEFQPPSLLVRFGQPASAACSVCKKDCNGTFFGLEYAVGNTKENGTIILWSIDRLTEWDTSLLCFYNLKDAPQCITRMNITLYHPPDRVSISFVHDDGQLLAGQNYTLGCAVQKVAPVENLKVTFYKGLEPQAQRKSTRVNPKPVDEIFTFSFSASEEDDGAEYWCEAQLDLAVQQVPPAVPSQRLPATVLYKPRLISPSSPHLITLNNGDALELNCSAVGQPSPSYRWTRPGSTRSFSNTTVYSKESVSVDDKGLYTCTVSNRMGTATVNFTVEVKESHVGSIIIGVIAVLLLGLVGCIAYKTYYSHNYMGQYNLAQSISCCRTHTPVTTSSSA